MSGFDPVGSTPVGDLGGDYVGAGRIVFHGSNVTANQAFPGGGRMIFLAAFPVIVTAAPRVTWFGNEVLHVGVARRRVTWLGLEVLRTVSTRPTQSVVTWMGIEALHVGSAKSRVTWIGLEVLRTVRRADTGWVSLIAA